MEKKKISCSYSFLVIILFATVCILTDYIVIDRKLREGKSVNSVIEDKSNVNENIVDIRTDSTKDYVYDASYENDGIVESYNTYYNTYFLKDIVVPFININSDDARKVNDEIRGVYNSAIDIYKKGIDDGMSYVDDCSYKYYINGDIISIVLTYGHGATDVVRPDYYIYNFNLKTGKLVSYNDVYSFVGFNSDDINDSVKNLITNIMQEKLNGTKDPAKETGDGAYYPEGTNFDTYNDKSYENYLNSINDGTIKYFIDSNKKLNVVVTLSIPAGAGRFNTIITVD